MCDKPVVIVGNTITKFVPNCIVMKKILRYLDSAKFSNGDIVFVSSDSVTFFSDNMGLATINLNNTNLDNDNFDDDDLETIAHVKLIAWCNTYKQHSASKNEISK